MYAGSRLNARLHSFQAFIAELQGNLIFALTMKCAMAGVARRVVGMVELFVGVNFGTNGERHRNSTGMDEHAPFQLRLDL
jgi:hypothetical protein